MHAFSVHSQITSLEWGGVRAQGKMGRELMGAVSARTTHRADSASHASNASSRDKFPFHSP